ncbi:PQQ-binding-like beta-propeller repeat protein [Stieleria sp. JC731]|uniref:outer membrane protein assembly factor BamB family protein n=1 Tax=Pirellulaceae TaxID=2691357 RepID=UPI001E53BD97|nr:PQQ-binding-like beta-propeller repeat protein [Stieleria sp. JC731]MCC9599871.1 PQQ-binding-like beta-propeller repeat protein [Stieleria sp. JC731]
MQYRQSLFTAKFAIAVMALVALGTMHRTTVWGQQQRFGAPLQRNAARFIEPPRWLGQQIRDAEEAIEQERYSDAIVVLGDLLERDPDSVDDTSIAGQDFFLGIEDRQGQRLEKSLLHHCQQLIGKLPEAALEIYELRYGALANKGLEQASQTRDWKTLRDVRRQYFHTKAGYQASFILAQRELYRGHPLAASMLLDDIVESSRAVRFLGNEVIALHAVACRLGGRSLPKSLVNHQIEISVAGSEKQPIRNWRGWIDEHYQFPLHHSIAESGDYQMLGGSLSRNESNAGQMPLTTPRWMLETTATPLDEEALRQTSDDLAASGELPPPSWSPLLVGNQLLMRTTERLRGVDHRTGKRVWHYPFYDPEAAPNEPLGGTANATGMNATGERLARTVFNDVPYGQLTSDGKRVFLLDDLMPSEHVVINPLVGVKVADQIENGRNTLVALDLATEGKILWRLGKDWTIESELNEAFFLAPPIAVEDELFTLVELSGDITLVCLDPLTGQMNWKQQLIAVEGAAIGQDPPRRVSGNLITYHEGVLICPTGTGATVTFNLVDRTLRWANSYERRASAPVPFGGNTTSSRADQGRRWHSSVAIASGNTVLVTPATTDNLFCYSVVDGKQKFSKVRQDAFYVAGIREDQFLVVGPRDVTAYDLENGRLNWQSDPKLLTAGDQIIGRGVFGDEFYIIPTSNNELIKLSLSDGKVQDRRRTTFPLGNLVAVDGEIISQGATTIAVALGQKTLGPRVDRILQEDPDNLDALIQKALLLAETKDRDGALDVLRKAREVDPDSDDVLLLSIALMLSELRDNPNPDPRLEQDLERIIDTPVQRLEFLALRLEASLRHQNFKTAAERLLELSTTATKYGPGGDKDSAVLRESTRDCDLDSWLAARASELSAKASQSASLDEIKQTVDAFLQSRTFGSSQELLSTTQHLRPLGAQSLVRDAVDRLIDEENDFAAERLLLGPQLGSRVLRDGYPDLADEDKLRLAKIYRRGHMDADALKLLHSVSQSNTASTDEIEKSIADITAEGEAVAKIDPTQSVSINWQQSSTMGISRTPTTQYTVRPTIDGGESFNGWTIANLPNAVMMQTPIGQYVPMPMDEYRSVRNSDRAATISGGLMISERPGRISAIDMTQMQTGRRNDALLWTRDFGGNGSNVKRQSKPTAFGDTVYSYPTNSLAANVISELRIGPIMGDRMLALHSGELLAISTATGEVMWRNSEAPAVGHMVVDSGKIAIASYMRGVVSTLTKFDLYDGQKADSKDWTFGDIWTSAGKHVLAYQVNDKQSGATVRLINPFDVDNQVVLETEAFVKQPLVQGVASGAGRLLQDRFMVLYDGTGRLLIWDIVQGRQICDHSTGNFDALQSMHAMWMKDRIIVFAAKTVTQGGNGMRTQQGDFHQPAHRMISIDIESGDLQWQREFENAWGITVHQPFESPVLLLSRSQTLFTVNRSVPKIDLAMIRLSDGETIHEELEKEVQPRSNGLTTAVILQPQQNRIRVQIDSELVTYQFGDEATEATPEDEDIVPNP